MDLQSLKMKYTTKELKEINHHETFASYRRTGLCCFTTRLDKLKKERCNVKDLSRYFKVTNCYDYQAKLKDLSKMNS